ncbi:MAG: MotA/TolQ/ExbB proton channel family protein [Actinobacteria bacterium]|nr:MotA/TolQ/ExbB proton channel family protein [Actinomycetota bacterium]
MNLFVAASLGDTVTDAVNEVAKGLRYPVLILALLALALVAYELGRLAVEAFQRSQRTKEPFDQLSRRAQHTAWSGDSAGAQAILNEYAYNGALKQAAVATMFAQNPVDAQRSLVDYDLYVSKRLDRVRLLVRSGPALGLMGTLIPLAPALAALGEGDAKVLADELQTAFAITVVGVAIGLIAFGVAVVRERYYTKDLADLEYLREIRGDAVAAVVGTPAPARSASAQGTDATDSTATIAPATAGAPEPAPAASAAPAAEAATVVAAPAPMSVAPAPAAAAAEGKKKKFGIKKKSKEAPAAAAAPVAPAFPPPPPPTSAPAPVVPEAPTDKSPSIPAPAEPQSGSEPAEGSDSPPATDGDGNA